MTEKSFTRTLKEDPTASIEPLVQAIREAILEQIEKQGGLGLPKIRVIDHKMAVDGAIICKF